MKKSPLSLRSLAVFLSAFAFAARTATAGVTYTWTGATAGLESDWSTATNWSPAAVPGTGDTAVFGAGGNPTPAPAGTSLLDLQLSSTAQAYTISGSLSMDAGGSITANAGSAVQSVGTVSFPGGGTITNNSANLLTVTALFSGIAGTTLSFGGTGNINEPGNLGSAAGGLVKNGSGTLTLGANNSSVSGGFTVNSGTVIGNNINSFSNKLVTLNGGTLQMNGNGTANYTGATVNGNATLATNTTINWTFGNGQVTSLLTATNTPVLTIRNAGTTSAVLMTLKTSGFDGTWKIGDATGGGTFMVNSGIATGGPSVRADIGEAGVAGTHILGTRAILADGTAFLPIPVVLGELKGANLNGKLAGRSNVGTRTTGTRYEVGGLGTDTTFSGSIVDGQTTSNVRQMNGNPDCTASVSPDAGTTYGRNNGIAGSQGTVEFVKTGAGTLTLLSANSHTGGTVLTGGTLAVGSDAALGAAYDGSLRPFALIPGTALYTAADLPAASLTGGSPSTPAAVGMFSSIFGNNANTNWYLSFSSQNNDTVTGNITNTEAGLGYTSAPTVSFTGGTTTTAGTPPVGLVKVKGLLTFDGGILKTNAALTSNRAVVVTSNNGYLDTNAQDCTLTGVLTGPGSIQHQGAGLLTLSGTGSSAGIIVAGDASTRLNGTTSGDIVVNEGGKLSGTGSTTGSVTVRADLGASGVLSPGASAGALGTGALTLHAMAKYLFEVQDWTGSAGTGYDTINAASLDVSGGSSVYPIAIHVSELALANFDGVTSSFTLVSTTEGITGFSADKFIVDATGFTSGAGAWSVAVSGNNLVLNYTGSATPYDTWAAAAGLAGPNALKTADPDKDGVTNLAEFAFNSSPNAGANPGGPNDGGIKPVTGGDALTLTIRVRSGALFAGATALTATRDGVTYRIEGSTDLSTWTADLDEVTPALSAGLPAADAGWEYHTFRFAAGVASTARAQIRAVASE